MTVREAYIYMFATLQTYWDFKQDVEVGDLLSGLDLWWYKDEKPSDLAYWNDWTKAVHSVSDSDEIDDVTALNAIKALFNIYKKQGFQLNQVSIYIDTRINRLTESYKTRRTKTNLVAPRQIKGANNA